MNDSEPPTFSTYTPVSTVSRNVLHEPAPRYDEDLWSLWERVDKSYKAVNESRDLLADLESQLATKTKESEKLKERSSKLFQIVHQKRSLPFPPLGRNSTAEEKKVAREEFEVAHKDETALMVQVEELSDKVKSLKENIEENLQLANKIDEVFELLAGSAAATLSPEANTTAEENLGIALDSYNQMEQFVADMVRARVTVQHAHQYYTTVLKTIDSVRGTAMGRLVVGGINEISKQQDYKLAMNTASKAQVCFNEAARVLTPHVTEMPTNILEDFRGIQERGLLQASKIYGFMYGWDSKTSGIRKSVEILLERQEEVFARLTHLAVWVQDKVPELEAQLRTSRELHDESRRELVKFWFDHRRAILSPGLTA